jgi:cyclase
MIATRVMPCLLLSHRGLVKTIRFKDPTYVGDPRNAVKIFSEKEVDELVVLDIDATPSSRQPQFELLREIVSEAFMPVAYGGGIRTLEDARALLALGIEKVVVCSEAVHHPEFIYALAQEIGSQSVVVCMDVKRGLLGGYEVYVHGGRRSAKVEPVAFAARAEKEGAGELMVNAIDRDGTMGGYDTRLLKAVTQAVTIPVIACGGAGRLEDFAAAVTEGGASAVAAGSLFVFHGRHRAVLISYPSQPALRQLFH